MSFYTEQVLSDYKKYFSNWNMVLKHVKIHFYLLLTSSFILFFGYIFLVFRGKPWYVVFMILFYLITFFNLNSRIKDYVKRNYKVPQDDFFWGGPPFWDLRHKLLKKYLKSKGIVSEQQLIFVRDMLYRRANDRKYAFVLPGLTLAITVALLNNLLFALFYQNVEILTRYWGVILLIIMILLTSELIFKSIKNFILNLINVNANKLKDLADEIDIIIINNKVSSSKYKRHDKAWVQSY